MRLLFDVEVDDADDIILTDDIEIEPDSIINIIRCAERRISARWDDFILDDVSAGIERFIQQIVTPVTKQNIESAIRECLSKDFLLFANDFDVYLLDIVDRKLPIIIKFNAPDVPDDIQGQLTFKVVINNENQRSYK
jgi:hypothetical protein